MDDPKKPTKQNTRDYLAQRQAEHTPPPDMKTIRRRMGWNLLRNNKKQK